MSLEAITIYSFFNSRLIAGFICLLYLNLLQNRTGRQLKPYYLHNVLVPLFNKFNCYNKDVVLLVKRGLLAPLISQMLFSQQQPGPVKVGHEGF